MISNAGTFNPPKPSNQVTDDTKPATKQPESNLNSREVSKDVSSKCRDPGDV